MRRTRYSSLCACSCQTDRDYDANMYLHNWRRKSDAQSEGVNVAITIISIDRLIILLIDYLINRFIATAIMDNKRLIDQTVECLE